MSSFLLAHATPHSFFHSACYNCTLELHWLVVALGHLDVQLPCPNMFIYVRACLLSGHELLAPPVCGYCTRVFILGRGGMSSMHFFFVSKKPKCCECYLIGSWLPFGSLPHLTRIRWLTSQCILSFFSWCVSVTSLKIKSGYLSLVVLKFVLSSCLLLVQIMLFVFC